MNAAAGGAPSAAPPAIVVGLDSITGLQATRILTSHGIEVIGVAHDRGHFGCRTRLARRVIEAPPGGDELIAALEALATSLPQGAVLLPMTDLSVASISLHRGRLRRAFAFRLPDHDVVMRLMDKTRFADLAAELGVAVPRTVVLRDPADARRAAETLTFPVVLKPGLKEHDWQARAGAKVLRAQSLDELVALVDRHAGPGIEFVAQEWVPGGDEHLYTCNAYFTEGGRPAATFVSRKLRQWPPRGGTGCLAVEVQNDDVLSLTTRLFGAVRFHGLAYLEVKQDPRTGTYLAIEPNVGRPTGRSAAAEAAGVDLLMTAYRDSLDLSLPPHRVQRYAGTKWIYLRHDLQSSVREWRRGRLTVGSWLRSLVGVKAEAVWSARDPLPFVVDWLQAAGKLFRRRRTASQERGVT